MCKERKYSMWPINYLKSSLLVFSWLFYEPIIECMLQMTRCDGSNHSKADPSMECYAGVHIFFLVLSYVMLILALAIAFATGILYQKTEPASSDALAAYLFRH
ncbi:MAG: hypothetical protein P4M11_15425 [Candidatus Pacebacteria bacterium]|nr:hypothetical protein [Candidatus Paceibacterota bacterium]